MRRVEELEVGPFAELTRTTPDVNTHPKLQIWSSYAGTSISSTSDATLEVSPNRLAPSSFTSKKCSPKHSLSHTLLLYCSQIHAGLRSATLLAASQAQGLCPRFWKPNPPGFPHCLPNDRVMNTAPGAGSKRTVIWDLG